MISADLINKFISLPSNDCDICHSQNKISPFNSSHGNLKNISTTESVVYGEKHAEIF